MTVNGWRAELDLTFEYSNGLTRLMHRRHMGPLVVQRPFHPEADGSAHVYILHPPGGVAGGDQLNMTCHLGPNARTVLTTPGATKFYRCDQRSSEQRVHIEVGAGGICEYLPQETILFDGAKASLKTRVTLAADSTYIGWDMFSFGRPASRELFRRGNARQRIEIVRDGRPIWFEQLNLKGEDGMIDLPFILAGRPIVGTMVYAGPMIENAVERIRQAHGQAALSVFSASALERVVVCRYLGTRISEAKTLFFQAWDILREAGLGKRATAPRIWAT